jgi:hypothetical protein
MHAVHMLSICYPYICYSYALIFRKYFYPDWGRNVCVCVVFCLKYWNKFEKSYLSNLFFSPENLCDLSLDPSNQNPIFTKNMMNSCVYYSMPRSDEMSLRPELQICTFKPQVRTSFSKTCSCITHNFSFKKRYVH